MDSECNLGPTNQGTCDEVVTNCDGQPIPYSCPALNATTCTDTQSDGICGAIGAQMVSWGCSWSGPPDNATCPTGYQYCGGCINACRSNAQSCTAHITNECGSGTPTPCPWCATAGQCAAAGGVWAGGGGYCSNFPTDQCCTLACDNNSWTTENGACGGACGACQRQIIKRSGGSFCGTTCVADPTCSEDTCTPACGQAGACGGTCSNVDAGTPAITTMYPADGAEVPLSAGGYVAVTFATDKGDSYELEVYPSGSDCTNPLAFCGAYASNTYYIYPGPYSDFHIRIRAMNTTCGTTTAGAYIIRDFTITGAITGTIYEDSFGTASQPFAGAICTGPATPGSTGTGAFIGVIDRDANGRTAAPTGSTYSIAVPLWQVWGGWPTPNNIVGLNPGSGFSCTCPATAGCAYGSIAAPQTGVDFFVTNLALNVGSWWQIRGGNAYSEAETGAAMYANLPATTCAADAQCTPYLMTQDLADTPGSAGVLVTAGGDVDTSSDQGYQTANVNQDGTAFIARGTSTSRLQENYEYFYRLYSMGTAAPTLTDVDPVAVPSDFAKPTAAPVNGRAYAYNQDLAIANPWTVNADESIVIFINGDLDITNAASVNQVITVAPGGFLAIIVSGDIRVNQTVGNPSIDDETTNVEGVFIANGTITIQGTGSGGDRRFVGAGNFIGWGGIAMPRDFRNNGVGTQNSTRPTDTFIFRPDFIENIPERMTRAYSLWQETN